MKKHLILIVFIFAFSFNSFCQDYPQGLIYSAQLKQGNEASYELYTENGEKIFDHSIPWAYSNSWDWLFVRDKNTNLITVYNYRGTKALVLAIEETKSVAFNSNRIALKKNGKWGYYDKEGRLIIPHSYDKASHFYENMAAVKISSDTFFIDTAGVRLPRKFLAGDRYGFEDFDISLGMYGFQSKAYKVFTADNKKGLMDAKGNIIVPPLYDELLSLKEHFQHVTVKQNGKYGVVAFDGRVIVPIKYEQVFVLNDYLSQ